MTDTTNTPDEVNSEDVVAVEFDFETEMENLNKLSDTLDKAKGTENE